MRVMLAIFLVMISACSSSQKTASSGMPDPLRLEVQNFKLDNGLNVLVVEDDRLPVFSLHMFYKVGGKDERKGITGASHFLEHLMFKGTKEIAGSRFDYIVEGNGGSSNAFTTNDMTVYHENMPSTALETMIKVEADRMVNLIIKKDEFEHERQVVLEERKMRYENSPRGQLYLAMMEQLFKGTPYGTSVIGDIEDLKSVSRDQVYRYYRQWYAPNNATLVVVGDVKTSNVKSLVKKYFSELAASDVPEQTRASIPTSAFEVKLAAPIELNLVGQSTNPMFMLAFTAAKAGEVESYAQDLLSSILGDGKSSHLMQKYTLSKRPKLASVYAGNYTLEKAGAFMIGGELLKGQEPEKFKNNLLSELKKSCETAVTERSLQKVKNQYETELFQQLDTSAGLAQFLGERQSLFNDWAYYRKELALYRQMTVKEVREACQKLFKGKNHVWVTVWEKNPTETPAQTVEKQ